MKFVVVVILIESAVIEQLSDKSQMSSHANTNT